MRYRMCGYLVYCGNPKGMESKLTLSSDLISHRGPDRYCQWSHITGWWGFHRLAIMDTSEEGDQPFHDVTNQNSLVCNGEIFNYKDLKKSLVYDFKSDSDCEVLLPLYSQIGMKALCQTLDGEFSFVLYDGKLKKYMAARDPIGIRPLFYGYTKTQHMVFASEMKALHQLCEKIFVFPPGHWFDGEKFEPYCDLLSQVPPQHKELDEITSSIADHLRSAVQKRLEADVPVGFLLSGGLDSSLVCGIAAKYSDKPLTTFAIGMEHDAIDLKYAKQVAEHLGTIHHEVIITKAQVLEALPHVIYHLESWDITTIRAAIGMYLICQYIKEKTEIKVVLTGEVSDELFGYKYTDYAPDAEAFQEEARKRISEIHLYDVLRADRCIAAHGLEARVPFGDKHFVAYVMGIQVQLKMNKHGIGKYLLRKAFEKEGLIPHSILMREKAAFSDAVGHSLVDILKEYSKTKYSPDEFSKKTDSLPGPEVLGREGLLYREIFSSFYPSRESLIPSYWLPNQSWKHCQVTDPSARVLPNYGASSH